MVQIAYRVLGALLILGVLPTKPAFAADPTEPPQKSAETRIVGVLEWLPNPEAFEYRLELYPLFVESNGNYEKAQTWACHQPPTKTAIEPGQVFGIYKGGELVGDFTVHKLEESGRACCTALVGLGEVMLSKEWKQGVKPGMIGSSKFADPRDPLLAIYPALQKPWHAIKHSWSDYRKEIMAFRDLVDKDMNESINSQIKKFKFDGANWEPPQFQGKVYTISRSGLQTINIKAKRIARQVKGKISTTDVVAEVSRWYAFKQSSPPEVLFDMASVYRDRDDEEGSVQYTLIDIEDLDGDGTAEAVYQVEGYESTGFSVYTFKKGQRDPVFRGAGYGC